MHDIEHAYKEDVEVAPTASPSSSADSYLFDDSSSHINLTTANDRSSHNNGNSSSLLTGNMPKPSMMKDRRLTETSAKYDVGNKGYLDETEQALRRMDTQNLGFLDTSKVYLIMQSLQDEQKNSARLMDTLQQESAKALQLKRALVVMIAMALFLAVANIGVSFAAARLAKDTQIQSSSSDMLSLSTGQRVGTTAKLVAIELYPYQDANTTRHRSLRELATASVCGAQSSTTGYCQVQGQMDYAAAAKLYQQFCPSWTADSGSGVATSAVCGGGGVDQVLLTCTGKTSNVLGGMYLPSAGPTISSGGAVTFPTSGKGYTAQQTLSATSASFGAATCVQEYSLGLYCDPSGSDTTCLVFAAWETSVCNGLPVQVCGGSSS